jgi:penicillin-binding protein 1A
VGALVVAVLVLAWFRAPDPSDLARRIDTAVAARGGTVVSLSDVAPVMRQAVVATEDERFYRHRGVDLVGVGRAALYDLGHLSTQQGASTITEQLAKELYLGGNDHSPWRKLEAAATALRIEASNTKEQILGAYLNTVYFGEGAYGIGAASRAFFGVAPSRLTLARASLLAGLIQSPSADDPYVDPAAARSRQASVLASMARNGFITYAEATRTLDLPLPLAHGPALPPDPGVTFATGVQATWPLAGLAVVLLALGVALLWLGRRRLDSAAVRIAGWSSLGIALLLAARAVRAD